MYGFYGYGNLQSPYWFIGLKEYGDDEVGDLQNRLDVWREGGNKEIEDAYTYCSRLGIKAPIYLKYFASKPRASTTWQGAIRILLALTPQDISPGDYQRDLFGQSSSDHCFLNLMPWPRTGTSAPWLYGSWSARDDLKDERTYIRTVEPHRIQQLGKYLGIYHPRLVVLFGSPTGNEWEQIADGKFKRHKGSDILFCETANTVFVKTYHPAYLARKGRLEELSSVGQLARTLLKGRLEHGRQGLTSFRHG